MAENNKKKCLTCSYFDNEKHLKDARTYSAGICKLFTEIVFQSDTCKNHITEKEINDIFVNQPEIINPEQLTLF